VGADGGVVGEVGGQDGFGGGDVGVEDGFLGFGVGEAVDLGGARGELEEGDGVGEVDGGGAAVLEVVEAGLDVGDGVLGCCGGCRVLEGEVLRVVAIGKVRWVFRDTHCSPRCATPRHEPEQQQWR
jgi:hypothetical protein